jgi:hypothetical protein
MCDTFFQSGADERVVIWQNAGCSGEFVKLDGGRALGSGVKIHYPADAINRESIPQWSSAIGSIYVPGHSILILRSLDALQSYTFRGERMIVDLSAELQNGDIQPEPAPGVLPTFVRGGLFVSATDFVVSPLDISHMLGVCDGTSTAITKGGVPDLRWLPGSDACRDLFSDRFYTQETLNQEYRITSANMEKRAYDAHQRTYSEQEVQAIIEMVKQETINKSKEEAEKIIRATAKAAAEQAGRAVADRFIEGIYAKKAEIVTIIEIAIGCVLAVIGILCMLLAAALGVLPLE